jgi:hypothetical protein
MKLHEAIQPTYRFVVPLLSKEESELRRTADEENLNYNRLLQAYQLGSLETLSEHDWKRMKNTESWDTTSLQKVKKVADSYGRDWNSLIKAFKQNKVIEAPIVLYRKGEAPYLVAGNTRLMCMRAMQIRPQIFKMSYEE